MWQNYDISLVGQVEIVLHVHFNIFSSSNFKKIRITNKYDNKETVKNKNIKRKDFKTFLWLWLVELLKKRCKCSLARLRDFWHLFLQYKSNRNFRDITRNVEENEILHQIFHVVSRFLVIFRVICRKIDYLWDIVYKWYKWWLYTSPRWSLGATTALHNMKNGGKICQPHTPPSISDGFIVRKNADRWGLL